MSSAPPEHGTSSAGDQHPGADRVAATSSPPRYPAVTPAAHAGGPFLTLVIPVYNTASFVKKCLESILGQGAPARDYEIIVVDDGSTDGSATVVAAYANAGGDLRIVSQQNSGLGAARNTGLANARGAYIWFIDSDDYLVDGALPKILELLERERPDVVALDYTCADEAGSPILWIRDRFETLGRAKLRGCEFFELNYRLTYAWLYVFRTALLKDNRIAFRPRINMQDAEMLPRALIHAEQVFSANLAAYVYVKRSESFINSTSHAVRERYFASVIEVRNSLLEFAKTVNQAAMSAGLRKKLNVIEEILFMSLVYDALDASRRRSRVQKLIEVGVYPFRFDAAGHGLTRLKREALRRAVNCSPYAFPVCFAFLRRLAQALRRAWTRLSIDSG
jgi:glycosyltransferase involved in cell wall biosynthesis